MNRFHKKGLGIVLILSLVISMLPMNLVKATFKLSIGVDVGNNDNPCTSASGGAFTYRGGTISFSDNIASRFTGDQTSISVAVSILSTEHPLVVTLTPDQGYEVGKLIANENQLDLTSQLTDGSVPGTKQFTLTSLTRSYAFEPVFSSTSGGGDTPIQSNLDLTVGSTEVVNDGVVQQASGTGWTYNHGLLTLNDNLPDNTDIDSSEGLFIEVTGDVVLQYVYASGNLEVRGRSTDGQTKVNLTITKGIECLSGIGNARFCDDLNLIMGSESDRCDFGFSEWDKITFENYNFHNRDNIDVSLYPESEMFTEVGEVEVISAKVDIKYNWCEMQFQDMPFTVFQEGEVYVEARNVEHMTYQSKYFSTYGGSNQVMTGSNISDLREDTNYVTTTECDFAGADFVQKECKYTLNITSNKAILKSLDPILYSVSNYDDADQSSGTEKGYVKFKDFEKGFVMSDTEAIIAGGETLTAVLMPKYGYQYRADSLVLNGQAIDTKVSQAQSEVGCYTITMPANAGHVHADFDLLHNETKVNTPVLNSLSMSETNIDNVNGNLQLSAGTVAQSTINQQATKIKSAAGADTAIAGAIDLTLDSVVQKNGSKTDVWKTNITELDEAMTVNITLDEKLAGHSQYDVVRIHEGAYANLDVKTIKTGNKTMLSFDTDSYSEYVIVYKDKKTLSKGTKYTDTKKKFKYTVTSSGKNPTMELKKYSGKAKTVKIPAKVKVNGITYKVTSVAKYAFKNNKYLTKLTIGSNITQLKESAFRKCMKLKSVVIPAKVTKLGRNCFYGCKKLLSMKIKSTKLKSVGAGAINGIARKATIKLPKSKFKKYRKLFKKSSGFLKSMKIK